MSSIDCAGFDSLTASGTTRIVPDMNEIATEDFSFSVTQLGSAFPGFQSGDMSKVDVNKSSCIRISGNKALIEKIEKANVSSAWGCKGPLGYSGMGTSAFIVTGSFTIFAGSMKCKIEGKSCMMKGDMAVCSCSGQDTPSAPPNIPVPFTGCCRVEITDAGQSKVRGI